MVLRIHVRTHYIKLYQKGREGRLHDKYENKVYTLPKHLDEKVARLHLAKLGVVLEVLSDDQADYISVPVGGPYKPEYYRY